MKRFTILTIFALLFSFTGYSQKKKTINDKRQINELLNSWHKAAAEAKFDSYFGMMTADAVFIGTDPTENWNQEQFKAFAKPYFDKEKAWNFTAVERNVFFSNDGKTAWFDELLDTQMKICRGSGILRKENNEWKIAHYVLSMTIPNDNVDEVVKIKTPFDNAVLEKTKQNQNTTSLEKDKRKAAK